jgi:hypothetical protein
LWLTAGWVVFSANERSGARSVDGEPNAEWAAAGHRKLWRLCTKRGLPSICGAVNGWVPIDARPKESEKWVVEETASLGRWRRHVKFLIRGWSRRDKAALCFPKPCISWHFRHRTWVHARADCLTPARRPLSRSAFLLLCCFLRLQDIVLHGIVPMFSIAHVNSVERRLGPAWHLLLSTWCPCHH